ncbi:hypothetical protein GCM10029976_092180 [Kribbella albertanoniae]
MRLPQLLPAGDLPEGGRLGDVAAENLTGTPADRERLGAAAGDPAASRNPLGSGRNLGCRPSGQYVTS